MDNKTYRIIQVAYIILVLLPILYLVGVELLKERVYCFDSPETGKVCGNKSYIQELIKQHEVINNARW